MIAKKVGNPKKSASKAVRIKRLTNYIREPERENSQEKCVYAGARGFITDEPHSQTAEMIALAQEAVRSKDTINHYVLSWREGEQPSQEQVEEAVSIFMEELGVKDHQAIYGLHHDTDNIHLHIAINRVHPETLKVVKINKGFDIEAAHRAIALIEHAQGWRREQNGRYQVLENGELGREHIDPDKPRQPSQPRRDVENRTGEKSAERIAIEDGAPIIKRAHNWEQLHRDLAAQGMRYEKTGSGAVVFVGDVGVKASSVDRNASLSKMEKRLGIYRPPTQGQQVAQREPEPIKPDVPGWEDYNTGKNAHYAEKNAAKLALDRQQEQERLALAEQQKASRADIFRRDWKGRGVVLNAMRSVVAAEQAAEKLALKERQREQREQWRQQFRPYPDFEQWQRLQGNPELAEQWRHRASEPQRIEGDRSEPPTPRDIRAYAPEIVGQQVHYSRRDDGGAGAGVSFVDKGRIIEIYDWRDRDSILAALQLSAQKWGRFIVTGNDEYKAMCARLAAEHGFKITNPELQESIQQERQWIQQERAQVTKPEQLKQFERYAEAVGAERYRVTAIKMREDGGKQTFILDKKGGITRGFTPQEIAQRTPEMQRLQRRGENLYYTPLSDDKHHILIDDMGRSELEKLVQEGYRPAVVLESSPGNYQAIITVLKLGTPHDRDVGNRLSERLNREYGDPKLSGAIHPHRAPGYENRKPKHQREDGSYPQVRLLKAERRECGQTLALSREIDAEYQEKAASRAQQPERSAKPALDLAAASGSAIDAYQRHYRDVLKRQQGGEVDLSRVDSMVAVRMRVTGHDQSAIEGAIRQCAPAIRQQDEARDWNDYAQRTARYAYSAAGDLQAEQLAKYRQQWEKLEGRGQAVQVEAPAQTQTDADREHAEYMREWLDALPARADAEYREQIAERDAREAARERSWREAGQVWRALLESRASEFVRDLLAQQEVAQQEAAPAPARGFGGALGAIAPTPTEKPATKQVPVHQVEADQVQAEQAAQEQAQRELERYTRISENGVYSYEITPNSTETGGGWRLVVIKDGVRQFEDCVFSVALCGTAEAAWAAAVELGKEWIAPRDEVEAPTPEPTPEPWQSDPSRDTREIQDEGGSRSYQITALPDRSGWELYRRGDRDGPSTWDVFGRDDYTTADAAWDAAQAAGERWLDDGLELDRQEREKWAQEDQDDEGLSM